jgi:hypothetical protein
MRVCEYESMRVCEYASILAYSHGAISSRSCVFVGICAYLGVFVYFTNAICGFVLISWVGVASWSFRLISTMGLSPLDHVYVWVFVRIWVYLCILQMQFVDFLDFLGRGSKLVISSHKHHGAISSRSCVFVGICAYLGVFVYFTNVICGFFLIVFGFPGSL